MSFNELSKEIHEQAIKSGWWQDKVFFHEIIALIHSELSEALEEYRNEMPNIYCMDYETCPNPEECLMCFKNYMIRKPEGIATELSDCVIRILDYCGKKNIDIDLELSNCMENYGSFTLPRLVAECHFFISTAYINYEISYLIQCINLIRHWCTENKIDLIEVIKIKHLYNKTRKWRHGNKKC